MNYKLLFSTFTIFYTTFDNINWSNPTLAGWISNGCLLLFLLLNCKIFKNISSPEYIGINICTLAFAAIIIYSGYANANLTYDVETWNGTVVNSFRATRFDHTVYAALRIVSFMLYFQHINKYNLEKKFLKYFFIIFLIYTIISNINALTYSSNDGAGYLVGNKFSVSYSNLLLVTLYYMRHPLLNDNRMIAVRIKLLLLMSLLISIKTECTTAVLGTFFMYIFIFRFKDSMKIKLYKWQTYLLLLIICDILFFFFAASFINNPVMKYIIVDVLGEDLTLTGRLNIYATLSNILFESPLWGYGLGNAHLFTMMNEIGANAQNGLFNLMLEVGILGCIVFFFLTIKMLKLSSKNRYTYPIVCLMYTMLILSSVEITFTIMLLTMNTFMILKNEPSRQLRRQIIKNRL